ncbi:MAG: amylo-alpha-1,6-glucosidase [Candidatus Acidiferrum sp.]
MSAPPLVRFGRKICTDLDAAEQHEWLVTNGLGGYASGTIAGSLTRRYHGLLVAALQPPVARTQLVAALDETVSYAGADYPLATHRWVSGVIDPQGFLNIQSFELTGTTPVWTYALSDALLEKRVFMRQGENTTFIEYRLLRSSAPLQIALKVLVNYRDFHSLTHANGWRMKIDTVEDGIRVIAYDGATPLYVRASSASCELHHDWYCNCHLTEEAARGMDDQEDVLFAALFRANLDSPGTLTLVASTEAQTPLDSIAALADREAREAALLASWRNASGNSTPKADAVGSTPSWLPQLVLAADQFIVKRSLSAGSDGRSVIAGYHWFGDWGRDTMIALPGLTLATGRPEVAKQILLAFAVYVDGGMLPNNFPDAGGRPAYNTVDAALWYFEAVRQYFAATQDTVTLTKLFTVLASMIDAHVKGTRYHIHVDPADGLIYAGGPGAQLTWMDAKIGDWVVTPRTGKPVEINALWINALETIAEFARLLQQPATRYEKLSAKAKKSFGKFWNPDRKCCYDVIDAPVIGNDPTLRPNQIFAVSLPVSPLDAAQQKLVVTTCAEHLLTPYGLRSLAPGEPGYRGRYTGGPAERDAAYHQGTVWGWLLGPFVQAHLRVHNDRATARLFLEPLAQQIAARGLGTLGEIFDGDAPFTPRGCIAQAWTVGEVLRVWKDIVEG